MSTLYTKVYGEEVLNYKIHLEILGYSPLTIKEKYLYLKAFFKYLEENQIFILKEIQPKDIAEYYKTLQQKRNVNTGELLTKENVKGRMRIIQKYFSYLIETETLKKDPASAFIFSSENERRERIIFTQSQIRELYKVTENVQQRNILNLAYGCGLRVGELVRINKEDINLQENLVIVEQGKNNKRRIVPITKKVKEELQEFLKSQEKKEKNQDEKAVFINVENRRMRATSFVRILKKLLLETEFGKKIQAEALRKIGIHTLRHSIATHLLENGMKLEQIQYFLGHDHIETTEIYTHIHTNQLKNITM
ncbi:integrase/recombinase XerD [Chryseobacterium ginsenosidimutans]|uniref:tyrosine-type recombinase/integrase n=1 Tax=Chryseobacterium ginsenosidimutans TaxID=687846 RepID=UPI00277F15E2|nr:tyrosine-type recombinase/integrase [Chryseobacterium ginsenosidimutans]MDQ0593705.1 integrase/recombinase XerD [Chryseobacterium ginsenosidimutans]MDQ0593715.1 integrase/recombinase XerD [Chryseobacterium ginsenosidimutans]